MKNFKSDRELLEEIYAWLCFNTHPSKDDIYALKTDIKKQLDKNNIDNELEKLGKFIEKIENYKNNIDNELEKLGKFIEKIENYRNK